MTSRRRALTRTIAALAVGTAGALLAVVPAGAVVPTTDLDPADLSRGADIAIPHLDGTTFVDGDRRVEIAGERATLLGRSGGAFIIGTSDEDGLGQHRVLRLRPDDSVKPLLRVSPWGITVSEDGKRLVRLRNGSRRSSPVEVYSARSGRLVKERDFPDHPTVLGMEGRLVLMSTYERGTFWWNIRSGRTSLLTRRFAGIADLGHDLLATYTEDPYLDGCTVLSRLSRPGRTLWTSCRERVESFNPDGTGIATVHILSDGVGPGRVSVRAVRGTLQARYDAEQWFGAIRWEDADTVLLDTNGTQYATVRCTLAACENATDPEPALVLRPAG